MSKFLDKSKQNNLRTLANRNTLWWCLKKYPYPYQTHVWKYDFYEFFFPLKNKGNNKVDSSKWIYELINKTLVK